MTHIHSVQNDYSTTMRHFVSTLPLCRNSYIVTWGLGLMYEMSDSSKANLLSFLNLFSLHWCFRMSFQSHARSTLLQWRGLGESRFSCEPRQETPKSSQAPWMVASPLRGPQRQAVIEVLLWSTEKPLHKCWLTRIFYSEPLLFFYKNFFDVS